MIELPNPDETLIHHCSKAAPPVVWDYTADAVAAVAQEAIGRLYAQETNPEFAGKAAGWTTPDGRKARIKALAKASAWTSGHQSVTVSAAGVDEADARISGTLGDVAGHAAMVAGPPNAIVVRISPFAYSVRW